jgi:hypothetical protein
MKPASPVSTPTSQELKKFGWTIGGIFLVLGLLLLLSFLAKGKTHSGIVAVLFLSFGALLVLLGSVPGLRESGAMRVIHRGWMGFAAFLGKYVGHYVGLAVFTLIYWILFTPVSLVARLVGFDPLGLRSHRKVDSYWRPREGALSSDHYEKQFDLKHHPEAEDSKNGA